MLAPPRSHQPPPRSLSASFSEEERSLQTWRELVQASVECELCNEPYGDELEHVPRLLACGHTFCEVLYRHVGLLSVYDTATCVC